MQPPKVDKVIKMLELANEDYATTSDVAKAIVALANLIKETKEILSKTIDKGDKSAETYIKLLDISVKSLEKTLNATIKGTSQEITTKLRAELATEANNLRAVIASLPPQFDPTELQNQIDVLMAWEPEKVTGIRVRDLLEALEEDDRLDASAIKNLPRLAKELHRQMGYNVALSSLLDVNIAGIIPGQTLAWNGVFFEPSTPAGGGGTPVWGEDLTSQGPGTSYTLAHTPVLGSVRLFRGGAYQSIPNGDYTISGATITLTTTTQSGEVLVADYTY